MFYHRVHREKIEEHREILTEHLSKNKKAGEKIFCKLPTLKGSHICRKTKLPHRADPRGVKCDFEISIPFSRPTF